MLDDKEQQPTYLTPEQAYQLEIKATSSNSIRAIFTIADGYYLHQNKLSFTSESEDVVVGEVILPDGKMKSDAYFGAQMVYYHLLRVDIPLIVNSNLSPSNIRVNAGYQGCAEQGICYPPMNKVVTVQLLGMTDAGISEQPEQALMVETNSAYLWPVLLAFVAGIALTFTPCVLPLIPILASIVVGQEGRRSRFKGGALSIAYVLGTAVTYTAVGIVAGASGNQLQAYFQNPWGIGVWRSFNRTGVWCRISTT